MENENAQLYKPNKKMKTELVDEKERKRKTNIYIQIHKHHRKTYKQI